MRLPLMIAELFSSKGLLLLYWYLGSCQPPWMLYAGRIGTWFFLYIEFSRWHDHAVRIRGLIGEYQFKL